MLTVLYLCWLLRVNVIFLFLTARVAYEGVHDAWAVIVGKPQKRVPTTPLLADLQMRDANSGEVMAETDRLPANGGSRISDEGQTDKVAENL